MGSRQPLEVEAQELKTHEDYPVIERADLLSETKSV